MATTPSINMPLSELPLWRLLVALDDAERTLGPASESARILVRTIRERMRDRRDANVLADAEEGERGF